MTHSITVGQTVFIGNKFNHQWNESTVIEVNENDFLVQGHGSFDLETLLCKYDNTKRAFLTSNECSSIILKNELFRSIHNYFGKDAFTSSISIKNLLTIASLVQENQ